MTFAAAFGISAFGTEEAATAKASDTYTGCRNAGSTRVMSTTVKSVAKAEIVLQMQKAASTTIIIYLRLKRDNKSGSVGPEIATASANRLTSSPAVEILTP